MRCNNSVSLSSSSITNRPRSSDLCTTRNTVLVKDWACRHHHAKKSIHKEKMIVLEPPSNQQWHVQCLDRPISHPHSSGTLSRAIKQGNMWKIMKRKIHSKSSYTSYSSVLQANNTKPREATFLKSLYMWGSWSHWLLGFMEHIQDIGVATFIKSLFGEKSHNHEYDETVDAMQSKFKLLSITRTDPLKQTFAGSTRC